MQNMRNRFWVAVTPLLLLLGVACAKQEPVSHFVIVPPSGQTELLDADVEKLKTTLDVVGNQYRMTKSKAGQLGIIRYYKPNDDFEIGFFAKKEGVYLKVYALPMTPSVASSETFRSFRQNLANVLSQTFPGQVSLEK